MVAGLIQLADPGTGTRFRTARLGALPAAQCRRFVARLARRFAAPASAAALVLVLGLLGIAIESREVVHAPLAAIAITLLFGIAGHLLARRKCIVVGIALGATAGPVILVLALGHGLWSPAHGPPCSCWPLAAASTSWRARRDARATLPPSAGLFGGAALAALLVALAQAELIAEPWRWPRLAR